MIGSLFTSLKTRLCVETKIVFNLLRVHQKIKPSKEFKNSKKWHFFITEEVWLARIPNTSIIAVVAVAATVALVFIALADVAVVVDDVFIVTQLAFFTQKMQLTFFFFSSKNNF